MRRATKAWIGVIAGALTVGAGYVTGGTMAGADDPIAERQRLMKGQGANMRDMQAKLKAGNVEGIAVDAENLASLARRVPALFPEGSLDPQRSRAKPEIWSKREEFEETAKTLVMLAEKLRDAARSKDQAATQTAFQTLGRQACGACHDAFRAPEKK